MTFLTGFSSRCNFSWNTQDTASRRQEQKIVLARGSQDANQRYRHRRVPSHSHDPPDHIRCKSRRLHLPLPLPLDRNHLLSHVQSMSWKSHYNE